jgi:adenylate kinase family enzyme
MLIFQDIVKLKKEVFEIVNMKKIKIISLDGKNGSGKSYLSGFLSKNFEYIHLNLDSDRYLIKNQVKYVESIRYINLKNDIKNNIDKDRISLIDGICVQKILDIIRVQPNLKIYVKRLSLSGHWIDGYYFDYNRDVEEILEEDMDEQKSFLEKVMKTNYEHRENIFHEIVRYHHEYRPDINADLIFERHEDVG